MDEGKSEHDQDETGPPEHAERLPEQHLAEDGGDEHVAGGSDDDGLQRGLRVSQRLGEAGPEEGVHAQGGDEGRHPEPDDPGVAEAQLGLQQAGEHEELADHQTEPLRLAEGGGELARETGRGGVEAGVSRVPHPDPLHD